MAQLNIKHKLSTAYHPQTDGQTERINQILKQYLRCFCDYQQTNQVKLLFIEILAYNISEHSITKRTPFFINKGFKTNIFMEIRKCEKLILYTVIVIEKIYKLQNKLRQNLIFFNRKIKKFTNKKKFKDQLLEKEIKYISYKKHQT